MKTTKPSITLAQMMKRFSTEEACKSYLRAMRWPLGVRCPRCNNEKVYELKARPFHWVCKAKDCGKRNGYRFSVITKTVFENTNYPLCTWFQVIYLMSQSKKGISALQIHRQIGSGQYRTAWYMCHRIRSAMQDKDFPKLMGEVEVDETFIGGKESNKHLSKRISSNKGAVGKIAVIGAIARKGMVVAKVIAEVDKFTLNQFVRKTVSSKVSLLATDENTGYHSLDRDYPHQTVVHSKKEYVRGNVHTQNIDGFWSLLKRGIVGNYHHVSKEYLPLYLAEFQYRYNNRKNPDIFSDIIAGC